MTVREAVLKTLGQQCEALNVSTLARLLPADVRPVDWWVYRKTLERLEIEGEVCSEMRQRGRRSCTVWRLTDEARRRARAQRGLSESSETPSGTRPVPFSRPRNSQGESRP